MNKLQLNTSTHLNQKFHLKRLLGNIAIGSLLFSGLLGTMDSTTKPVNCSSCTYVIDRTDNSTLNLTGGEIICITSSGEFTGVINRNSGSGTVIICNEGTFSPTSMNLSSGDIQFENYGDAIQTDIDVSSSVSSTNFINYDVGVFEPKSFQIEGNSSYVDNYGDFETQTFDLSNGANFTNFPGASSEFHNLTVNSSNLNNQGEMKMKDKSITLSGASNFLNSGIIKNLKHLTINGSSFDNSGNMELDGKLTVNSASDFVNSGNMEIESHITIDGTFENIASGTMSTESHLTIGNSGSIYSEGSWEVEKNLTLNGTLEGPLTGNYSWMNVTGKTTINSSGVLSGNFDLCDGGNPNGGLDKNNGSVGGSVSFCENNHAVLPVELIAFAAEAKDKWIDLNWSTASELNNMVFTIERSSDGTHFEPIGEVPGAGTTQSETHYAFRDDRPLLTKSYYRLKQIDFDGAKSHSPQIEVNANKLELQIGALVYPNPTYGMTNLIIRTTENLSGELNIMDITGKTIYQHPVQYQAGEHKLQIDLSSARPGIYFVNLRHAIPQPFSPLRLVKY